MAKKENKIPNLKSNQKISKFCDGRAIRFRCGLQNTICDVLRAREGWVEAVSESEWDFIWSDKAGIQEIYDNQYLEEHVKLNHFRNHYELTRKNLMAKKLKEIEKTSRKRTW